MPVRIGLNLYDSVTDELVTRSQSFKYGNCRNCLSPGYAGDTCCRCGRDIVIQLIYGRDNNVHFVNPVGLAFLCAKGEWCMELIPLPIGNNPILIYRFGMGYVRRICDPNKCKIYMGCQWDQNRILWEIGNEAEYCAFREVGRVVNLILK